VDAATHQRPGVGDAGADRVGGGRAQRHRDRGRNGAGKWRSRFVEHRLDGRLDEPRPGRPRTITDEQVEEVVITTLATTPRDATHWSTRSMAREVGLTQSAVLGIWRAFGLQPHRQETWKLSTDPQFIARVRDIVGLYVHPPGRAVVLCVDEKSQIQAVDRTAPILPMLPGTPERATPNKLLRRGAHRSVRQLNADIRARIDSPNENPRPFVWTKTAEEILDSIARYCQRINASRH
jgi:transposase